MESSWACRDCGDPMSLQAKGNMTLEQLQQPPASMWHYLPLLPIAHRSSIVSLGEGAVPLLEAPRLASRVGLARVRIKNETVNPTGSFKDRQISVALSRAREEGLNAVAAVSSGNVAAATAAYAARVGMKATLYMHGQAGGGKIAQAAAYGATVKRLDIPNPSKVFDICMKDCRENGWAHLSTAGMYNPFNVEGAKTIAYELFQQTQGALPDFILAPVGGGGLLGGVWRGFLDLRRMGFVQALPRLIGVQAAGCAPLKQAMDNHWSFRESLEHPWATPNTIAGGIADDILFDGHTALSALRETNGLALVVDDDAIRAGKTLLAESEGILCELTSASVIAALRHLADLEPHADVCCILTGSGMKELPGAVVH